jgi:hypothetical protein
VVGEVQITDVRSQVTLLVFTDLAPGNPTDPDAPRVLTPAPGCEPTLIEMMNEVVASRSLD